MSVFHFDKGFLKDFYRRVKNIRNAHETPKNVGRRFYKFKAYGFK